MEFRDVADQFELVEETVDYHDGPLQGCVRERATGELFAFRTWPIVVDRLWHWVMVPCATPDDFEASLASPPVDGWLSIVEDRRQEPGRCSLVRMSANAPRPQFRPHGGG